MVLPSFNRFLTGVFILLFGASASAQTLKPLANLVEQKRKQGADFPEKQIFTPTEIGRAHV